METLRRILDRIKREPAVISGFLVTVLLAWQSGDLTNWEAATPVIVGLALRAFVAPVDRTMSEAIGDMFSSVFGVFRRKGK